VVALFRPSPAATAAYMPRGDKSKYADKQERKADHIAESYESRGMPARSHLM
jgi:hypothetical protein